MKVRACVITGYGINADRELVEAFSLAGSEAVPVHVQDLIDRPAVLRDYQILGFPGGFSFGDHLGSGLVFAHLIKKNLKEELASFLGEGKLVIGICIGFQVLVKMGILPNIAGQWEPEVTLIHNNTGLFTDRWVNLRFNPACGCVWTRGLSTMELPIRPGEGRFVAGAPSVASALRERNLIAVTYEGENPNGSELDVAGITDTTGRVLGLMPHPEAFMYPENHPRWTREGIGRGAGLDILANGVRWLEKG